MKPDDLLTTKEAAALMGGVTDRRVRALIKEGRITATRLGDRSFIRRADAEAWQPKAPHRPAKNTCP